jgi:hypothetical protein
MMVGDWGLGTEEILELLALIKRKHGGSASRRSCGGSFSMSSTPHLTHLTTSATPHAPLF